jgi:tetratricopeptide (TPR) repeat protein
LPPESIAEGKKPHMFVVTFYSYKGGVGRTSALVNVAYRLARSGKRVFILDFDLEAPGVDSYGLTGASEAGQGLVEYIDVFMRTGEVPSIRDFVIDATHPGTVGKLFVMPAGRKDESYKSALSGLDWKILYRQKKGYLFIENMKAAIHEQFKPDYLLVDSRTGLTDISGICTLQLPHLVVLLFSLNQQNINGISPILKAVRANKVARNIATLLVASPVPDMPQWVEARSARFEHARRLMGSPVDLVLPYDPFLAFKESIVDGHDPTQPQTYLGKAYDALTEKVISANPGDVLTLLRHAAELKEEGTYELAELRYREAVDTKPDNAQAWFEFGKFERLQRKFAEACQCFERAHALAPADCETLAQLATTYVHVDKSKSVHYFEEYLRREQDAQRLMRVSLAMRDFGLAELSLEGILRATNMNPGSVSGFIELGQTHMQLRHYRQALEAYKQGTELDPNNLPCVYNIGAVLARLGDPRSSEYFAKAIEIWEKKDQTDYDTTTLANYCEAISNAYLALGKIDTAVNLLEKALELAKEVKKGKIFSSGRFVYLPPDKFVLDVTTRLEGIRRRSLQ